MPDSQNPQVPDFVPGVGRLVTDRYDFQSHVDGTGFRHQANQIDLFPTVVISGNTYTDVQDAIGALATAVSGIVVPQATASVFGIIKLGGDLAGIGSSAAAPIVGGLQGRPVQNLSPTTGQVLTWTGSYWTPASSSFTPGGDLAGTGSSQQVIGLTGVSSGPLHVVNATADVIQFGINSQTLITQNAPVSNQTTNNMVLAPQPPYAGATIAPYVTPGNLVVQLSSPSPTSFYPNNEASFLVERMDNIFHTIEPLMAASVVPGTLNQGAIWLGPKAGNLVALANSYNVACDGNNLYLSAPVTDNSGSVIITTAGRLPNNLVKFTADSSSYTTTNMTIPGGLAVSNVTGDISITASGNINMTATTGGLELSTSNISANNSAIALFSGPSSTLLNLWNWQPAPGDTSHGQAQVSSQYSIVVETVNASTVVSSPTFNLPDGQSCLAEVKWVHRTHTGGNVYIGYNAFYLQAVSGILTTSSHNIYATGVGAGSASDVILGLSGNNFNISVTGQAATTLDWELFITLNFC